MKERWIEYTKKADFDEWSRELHISPVAARVLRNRDIETLEEARHFLYDTMRDLSDPLLMKDMAKGADILEEAVRLCSKIAVVSDFDDDGIFAGQILYEGIRRIGGEVILFTPNRVREGYGINCRIIDEAKTAGCRVILTCDNGIAAKAEVAYAREQGFQVVVTDHHEVQETVPSADAVIDPKQPGCGYPFKQLCGAGVAFRLIQVLYRRFNVPEAEEESLYEYAAIATVADVVELKGENRILVKAGLEKLHHTEKAGLGALIDACELDREKITAYHLGYVIGPCFNAVGRLSDVRLAFDLLQTKDPEKAAVLAEKIRGLNEVRKDMTEQGVNLAIRQVEELQMEKDRIMVVRLEDVHESVVGIIAGRLKEKYNHPVFVFTNAGNVLKGSGRSIPAYHILNGLMGVRDLPERFGGHAMAAGLSIREEKLEEFRVRLNAECSLSEEELRPIVRIDARLPLSFVTKELIEDLDHLEPFGTGNPKPVFARPHFSIRRMRVIGRNSNVVRMTLSDHSGAEITGLIFDGAQEFLNFVDGNYGSEERRKAESGIDNRIDTAFTYYPSVNDYKGEKTLQIVCKSYCQIP